MGFGSNDEMTAQTNPKKKEYIELKELRCKKLFFIGKPVLHQKIKDFLTVARLNIMYRKTLVS